MYGSDAITGVVNFIMRDDFQGLEIRGQGGLDSSTSTKTYSVDVTGGGNFADGRGNAVISVNYLKRGGTLRGAPREITPWRGEGGHGGGDDAMLADIFDPKAPADKYARASDQNSGAYSILIGAAANQCFQTGAPVRVADMVTGLKRRVFTAMPTGSDPVPMPPRRAR